MAIWEWIGSGSVSKDIIIAQSKRMPNGNVPNSVVYDEGGYKETINLTAKAISESEKNAEIAKIRGIAQNYTYIRNDGTTITGIPIGLSWQDQEGMIYKNVTLTLEVPWENK